MASQLTRADLVASGGRGGAALLLAGSIFGGRPAAAAATPPDNDLAYARLLVGVELLAIDFYSRALAAKRFGPTATNDLKRARADERRHYLLVAAVLIDAGQAPATSSDIDFSYPAGTFASRGSIAKLGIHLESVALGAYLGAVDAYQTNALKLPAAQIAANEAEHRSVFTALQRGQRIGPAFAAPLRIDQVSDALDAYAS